MTKAKAIEEAIKSLADANGGRVTPAMVVDAARNPASVLHDQFDWNDASAAEKNRLDTARTLIRSVKVIVKNETMVLATPLALRDVTVDPGQQGYILTANLLNDEEAARLTILRYFTQAQGAMNKAREVAAALGRADDIDKLLAGLAQVRAQHEAVPPA